MHAGEFPTRLKLHQPLKFHRHLAFTLLTFPSSWRVNGHLRDSATWIREDPSLQGPLGLEMAHLRANGCRLPIGKDVIEHEK